jgi:hypothetical protein
MINQSIHDDFQEKTNLSFLEAKEDGVKQFTRVDFSRHRGRQK